jgi:chromosome segregation protein
LALAHVEASIAAAMTERDALEAARRTHDAQLTETRARRRELAAEHDSLTDATHRDEMAMAEQRMRLETLAARALEDYGVEPETLVAEYGPNTLMPPDRADEVPEDEEPVGVPYDRAVAERRATAADRQLALLGRVNPLALEEFAALEERHAFLSTQLEDLKATRRDLMTVVAEVDERIRDVFRQAFEDTAREFEQVFATLFPGGEGRLVLTEPDDLLATGIEVEARLTAIALLFAIFRARPSPFYVLDEVEAALDDRNLGRLLDMLEDFRGTSQLLVVTHQKRTMEVADALYGVSMRGDGISTVISQRLREREDAPV